MHVFKKSAFTMNVRTYPLVVSTHAVALLRKLNFQRMEGQFCDCVIRQHLNPVKLYLAHKNVLSASSPVLASLLPSKGALLDLQFPSPSTEILGFLLEFIYTGTLPPPDQDESIISAATYLQMDELQKALIRRSTLDTSSESDCTVAADIKPNIKRKCSDQQQNKKNEHSPSQCTPTPLSCEVVPVICHVSTTGKPSLLSETRPKSRKLNSESDVTIKEAGVSERKVTLGHGHNLKHYGLQTDDNYEAALYESQPKQSKILSGSACSNVQDVPMAAPEDAAYYTRRHQRELDEKSVLQSSGNAILTHTAVCSEIGEEDDTENTTNQEFTSHFNTSSHYSRIHSCPHLDKTSKGSDNEGVTTIDQLESNKEKGSKCHPTRQFENISDDEYIPDNAIENTPKGKLKDLWSSMITSGDCPQGDETKCFQSASRLNLWTEATSYSTLNPKLSEEVTSNESRCDIKGSNTNTNEMETYQGQVRYHYLAREKHHPVQSSDSDDDGLYSAMANSDLREGLGINVKASTSDFVLLDISAKHPSAGYPDSNGSQLGVGVPASASVQPYQCTMCDRAFSQRGSLNRHMRSHLGVRPYSCPQCPMTFSRQYRVTEHMRVHQRGCEDLQRTGPT